MTDPEGVGLLLSLRDGMTWGDVAWQVLLAAGGLAALASAAQGYGRRILAGWERWAMALAGLLMVFPALVEYAARDLIPHPHWVGIALAILLLVLQRPRRA